MFCNESRTLVFISSSHSFVNQTNMSPIEWTNAVCLGRSIHANIAFHLHPHSYSFDTELYSVRELPLSCLSSCHQYILPSPLPASLLPLPYLSVSNPSNERTRPLSPSYYCIAAIILGKECVITGRPSTREERSITGWQEGRGHK